MTIQLPFIHFTRKRTKVDSIQLSSKTESTTTSCEKNGKIFTFFLNATSGMGKLEIFRTETPRRTHLLSFGEDQTVVSLKL